MLCRKCVLPESRDIRLNEDGVCNICAEFEKTKADKSASPLLETDLIKLLNRHRGKGTYDCLVMCSGGKDSTAALYFIKKRYRLNPLAFTFDHGFESEEALRNVKTAAEALDVDFLHYKSLYMKDLFAKIVRTGSPAVLCHSCSIWYMRLTYDFAARFGISVIVAGWTRGQSTARKNAGTDRYSSAAPEYRTMARATKEFITAHGRTDPKYRDFPLSMEEAVAAAGKRHKAVVVSPHWFLPFDQETYTDLIARELGWKAPELSYPKGSTNCLLNFLSVHYSMKNYGYTHYHIEMSKLIRQGLLTREQALEALETGFDRGLLESIAGRLGCTLDGAGDECTCPRP